MKHAMICILFFAAGTAAHAASFDCAKAATSIEKAICADDKISDLDGQLMQSYKKSMATSANADALRLEQRSWLANVRNKCQDVACLKLAYAGRIAQLDGAATPAPALTAQNVPVASAIDQPKANEPLAVAATPSDIAQASVQPMAAPQPQKVEASSQVTTPAKPAPVVEAPAASPSSTNPGIGITDLFHVLFSIGMIALVVGMVRPSLAAKWVAVPTRKKIFGLMLIYLIPVAALSSLTETPERKAYEASLRAQKEAEKVAKREERESKSSPAHSGGSRYQNNVNRFVAVVHRAKKSGAMSRNPSCGAVVESAYGEYIGKMERDLQQARRDDPRSERGLLRAVTDTAASQLEMHISNIENLCNGQ
jgi:uncharacterized protein